jgi:4-amino-4-deoxy-L-arabinose transferase-like glycosyltransferase
MFIVLGRNLLSGKGYTLNGLPNATFPFGMPVAAGVFLKLTGSARWSANLATIVFGSLGVIPVYLIARELWGRLCAVTAAILYAGFPALLFLVPYCTYSERLYAGSEAVFLFFILSAACVAVIMMRRPTLALGAAFGFFGGIAFQVRQEALAYFLPLAAAVCILGCAPRRPSRLRALAAVAAALVVFAIIAAPFVLWVRSVTGRWSLGPRFPTTFRMRKSLENVVKSGQWGPALKEYFGPAADDSALENPYYGVAEYHRPKFLRGDYDLPTSEVLAAVDPANLPRAWSLIWRQLMPPGAWILVLVGFVSAVAERKWRVLAVTAAIALPTAFVAAVLYALARFYLVLPLVLLFFGARGVDLCAQGAVRLLGFAVRTPRRATAVYVLIPLVLSLWFAEGTLQEARLLGRDYDNFERRVEMQLDEFIPILQTLAPPRSRLVGFQPVLEACAGVTWLAMPEAEPARIVSYSRKRKADFLLVRNTDGYWVGYSADDVISILGEESVVLDREFSGDRFVLFDLRPAGGADPTAVEGDGEAIDEEEVAIPALTP